MIRHMAKPVAINRIRAKQESTESRHKMARPLMQKSLRKFLQVGGDAHAVFVIPEPLKLVFDVAGA